jgi:demethoxyubiquinone hydroxylase (CLK1/Coq7/Cat5 family)
VTPAAAVCFGRHRPAATAHRIDTGALPPAAAHALADALPFLQCGEESAVHAFGQRLAGIAGAAEQVALDAITADEQRHADWLEALAAALPAAGARPDTAAMAAFFRRLLTRDPALHFARIAALDLAVCAILQPLTALRGALGAAPAVVAGLAAIRRDEARHVRIARHCAGALGFSAPDQRALDLAMRAELAALLGPVRTSLDALGFGGFDAGPRHAGH